MKLEEVDNKNPTMNQRWTPLHLAADNGHLEVFKFINEKVLVKNPKTIDGFTPQELAVGYCKRFIATTQGNSHHHGNILSLIWTRIKNLWK